jgi:hypothetical protein
MPTLDDTTTLQKNAAVAANDALAVVNKGSGASSQIEQVPAALLTMGYTHAWRIDYDHPTLAANTDADAVIGLHTFGVGDVITKCAAVVVTGFDDTADPSVTTGVTLDVGVDYSDGTTDDPDAFVDNMAIGANGSVIFRQNTGAALNADATDEKLNTGLSFSVAANLEAKITAAGSGAYETDHLGQGSVIIMAQIIVPSEFSGLVSATTTDVTAGGAG